MQDDVEYGQDAQINKRIGQSIHSGSKIIAVEGDYALLEVVANSDTSRMN